MSKQPNLAVSSYMQAEEIEFCLWLEGILTGFFSFKKKNKILTWELGRYLFGEMLAVPGVVGHAYNPGAEEAETGLSLGSLSNQPKLICKPQLLWLTGSEMGV